ncbi:YjbH domain-containing protein [Vannielia sp. SX4]|uniref:YjbH domain-containing protein n=1 Tax=Vannielia sp. SX4 TaxID=3463852 RepID=UPI0040597341
MSTRGADPCSGRPVLGWLLATGLALAVAPSASAQTLSFYGTPGLVDMPTAEALPDGSLALTTANYGPIWRHTLTFQLSPRVSASFRYAAQGNDPGPAIPEYDRSFDLNILLREEDAYWPAIALGLRDFGGTGIYSGEYVVASKYVTPTLQLTGGIGWGRFAGRGRFENPLGILNDRFETRPEQDTRTGEIGFDQWFRGDAAFFGGLKWHATERLTLVAEYSSDTYRLETTGRLAPQASPYNFGLNYRFRNGLDMGAYYLYGNTVGVRFSYVIDPVHPRAPGGQETAPPSLLPRSTVAGQSWNLGSPERQVIPAGEAVRGRLGEQGLRLMSYHFSARTARVQIENLRFDASAQAVGRAARVLANTVAPSVERFEVTLTEAGMPMTTVTVARADLEEQEHALEGEWHMLARAQMNDAFGVGRAGAIAGAYPRLSWGLSPYAAVSLFDPDDPLRYELGVQLNAAWEPHPGLIFSGQIRKPLTSTIDDATRRSDSVLPHVRSDAVLYAQQSDLQISHLTAEYFFRPREDMFGRVTLGYLEPMFGGVSAELLWYPLNSRLALGAELNYAVQRDFDQLFGFQDYSVWTGHASAYYDLGRGYHGQLDVGRYLAGDWGATLTLDRRFKNGFKVGAFATLTDVSFDDFGEGSFDKGIFVELPLSWVTGQPSRAKLSQTVRPILRDGGARLGVRNRLYGVVEPFRGREITNSWGKFLR